MHILSPRLVTVALNVENRIMLILEKGDVGSYAIPMENIPLIATFLHLVILRRHRTGIGRTTTVTSINRLNAPRKRSKDLWFPHVPLIVLSQLYSEGRHNRQHATTRTAK